MGKGRGQEVDGDDEGRASWGGKLEFILTCVGYAVGLGNVWRFPYLVYRNGGGAFLIPYILMLLLVGLPIFFFELSFGQFASLGPIAIWTINPICKGIGMGMIAVSWCISLYYNIIITYSLYYLFASMGPRVPWADCNNYWNTQFCMESSLVRNVTARNITMMGRNITSIDQIRTPSHEYFYNRMLQRSDSLNDFGSPVWQVTLLLMVAWTIVFLVLVRGIGSLGKVVYVTSTFPYIMLTIMLVRGATLPGARVGIEFYVRPNVTRLRDVAVWSDAATQIFYSLSACSGGLIAMASYNQFKNNIYRDSMMVPIINCLTSIYAGFVIFSVLGFMAQEKGVSVDRVATQGPGLVFVVYPEALSQMPVAPLWSILFFIMMIMLGFSSQFAMVEGVFVAILDEFPNVFRSNTVRPLVFRAVCCAIFFLITIPMTCNGGFYLFSLVDDFVSGFPLLFIGFFELTSIVWVYGYCRFAEDITLMLGKKPNIFFTVTWCFVTPVILVVTIIAKAIDFKPPGPEGRPYPPWGQALGWCIVAFTLFFIPVWFVGYWLVYGGCMAMRKASRPLPEWGPALPENRTGRYATKDVEMMESIPKGRLAENEDGLGAHPVENGTALYSSISYVPYKNI